MAPRITRVVFIRTADCSDHGPGWTNCDRLVATVKNGLQARWLYSELRRMIALNRAAVAHGHEPAIFCPNPPPLRFRLAFLTARGRAARATVDYNAGPCARGTFVTSSQAVKFDLWMIEPRFRAYLVQLSRDIGITPQQLCPKSEAVSENICGF